MVETHHAQIDETHTDSYDKQLPDHTPQDSDDLVGITYTTCLP